MDWKPPTAIIIAAGLAFELVHGEAVKPHVEPDVKAPNSGVLRYSISIVTSADPFAASLPLYREIDLK